jgi:hypothetical protein
MSDLHIELTNPRDLSDNEWKILNKILSINFSGKDLIYKQLKTAKVISCCPCGCKTVDIQVDDTLPKYELNKRIPVELKTFSKDGIPIIASIHLVNGYINELEIYRADSGQICEDIDLDNSSIEVF